MEKTEKKDDCAAVSGASNQPPAPSALGPSAAPTQAPAVPASPLEISSETLLGGRSEIRIHHRGDVYRLTVTRAGKLILHK
jgi:hemin uptake protein HemP